MRIFHENQKAKGSKLFGKVVVNRRSGNFGLGEGPRTGPMIVSHTFHGREIPNHRVLNHHQKKPFTVHCSKEFATSYEFTANLDLIFSFCDFF